MNKTYPEQCKCGGYFSHSSACPKYEKLSKPPEHKQEPVKPVKFKTMKPNDRYRVMEKFELPNPVTDYQLATGVWITPIQE